jgi:membrane-associated phospholipid phosphatase
VPVRCSEARLRFGRKGVFAVFALALVGCASLPSPATPERALGGSFQRLGEAARRALADPYTWAPALGAAAAGVARLDRPLSRWAADETPLFGSRTSAKRASDLLVGVAGAGAAASILVAETGETRQEAAFAKGRGLLAGGAGLGATGLAAWGAKEAVGRERPDGSSRTSFPSAHSAEAWGAAYLGRRSLERLGSGNASGTRALEGAFLSVAATTGWARIEAEKHFPSDVLAGAALGNLLTAMTYDFCLGGGRAVPLVVVDPASRRFLAMVRLAY